MFALMRARLLVFSALALPLAFSVAATTGCASMKAKDPLQVTVAGVEPLQGEGMELRLNVKLRVQNPNDAPIDYNGVAVEMMVQGKTFATGVSDAHGNVPRFGEAVIEVPVTASAFRMARQALGMMKGGGSGLGGKISYQLKGKLNGSGFSTIRFQNQGEFEMPTGAAGGT
jgi:LEA14-like dessication related protein